jgi:hypothetical protein
VRPATVDEVFQEVQPASDAAGGPLVRALQPAPAPDLQGHPERLAGVRATIGSFAQLVPSATTQVAAWEQRLLESGSADLEPAERSRYLEVIEETIGRRLDRIDSPESQTVTLTSREGVIPFTLRNELDQPVELLLELQGGSAIEFPGGADRLTERVEPGSRQIRLRVHTRSPGVIPVTVRVTSPDGGLLVTTSRVTVRSTAVSGIGYVLTIGAAGFLVVWWFRHWRRARRERRLAAGT